MMETILMMLLSSLWSLLIMDFFTPFRHFKESLGLGYTRTLKSDYILLEYVIYVIHKVLNCAGCLSAHIFWITYLITYGSFYGMLLCPIVFFLTFVIKEKILTIEL